MHLRTLASLEILSVGSSRNMWDPVKWWRRDANGKMVSFFHYSIKLGREFQ